MVLANSSLISPQQLEEKNILKYPFSDLAGGLGDLRVANVVALGAYLAKKKIIRVQTVGQVIKDIAPAHKKDLIQINLKALDAGLGLIR
jgi:2-oxoglutarate ferredoxin oxidoreductase subunit gamma